MKRVANEAESDHLTVAKELTFGVDECPDCGDPIQPGEPCHGCQGTENALPAGGGATFDVEREPWVPSEGAEIGANRHAAGKARSAKGRPDDWASLSEGERHAIRQATKRFLSVEPTPEERGDHPTDEEWTEMSAPAVAAAGPDPIIDTVDGIDEEGWSATMNPGRVATASDRSLSRWVFGGEWPPKLTTPGQDNRAGQVTRWHGEPGADTPRRTSAAGDRVEANVEAWRGPRLEPAEKAGR